MKLQYATSRVDNQGSLEHRQATIDLNPTIAHVLSRDLYQRPIESMFREIVINAIDAHREAGQDEPVSIHIPTAWDETFSVRDYGNGLKHTDFMDIYLAYGASSRRDSDAVHGGLGLGTKSPLAYTSAFAVSSFVGGIRNDYLVYYDEDNLPCVDHRCSEATSEASGLLVSLTTVSSYDYVTFKDAAAKILQRIPADKYVIENGSVADTVIEKETGSLYDNLRLASGSGIYIVMGYVAYQMDPTAVLAYLNGKGVELNVGGEPLGAAGVIERLSSNGAIEIISEIGAYPVHPSREYVNVTPRAVKTLCADISRGLKTLFKDDEDDAFDVTQDVLQSKLTGIVRPTWTETKMRGRFLHYYGWRPRGLISAQINDYGDFITHLVRNKISSMDVAGLPSTQLTDYLGNGRNSYDFSPLINKGVIASGSSGWLFIFDTPVLEASGLRGAVTAAYTEFDISELADEYAKRRDTADPYATSYVYSPRTVVRSMQDKSHNVLVLKKHSSGNRKRDWQSQKLNVAGLKALGKQIFWVPTHQGCIKDEAAKSVISKYFVPPTGIPKWRVPVIIGLPASKGTKTIEAAFQPISELEAYVEKIYASDSYKRKQLLHLLSSHAVHREQVEDYAAYGSANRMLRLNALYNKYGINNVAAPDNIETIPEFIDLKALAAEIYARLPVPHHFYRTFDHAAARQWGEQLAKLTNNHPTGAKAKNDPYYLS